MTKRTYTSRSMVETAQRCPRRRWLANYQGGQGIESVRRPLPLAVGGAVHEGLAALLRACMDPENQSGRHEIEEDAVAAALAAFQDDIAAGLELDVTEAGPAAPAPQRGQDAPFGTPIQVVEGPLERGVGQDLDDWATLEATRLGEGKAAFDKYLASEQAALVEALVRAYARRRLPALLEAFEVLEVEREGEWILCEDTGEDEFGQVVFQSRPDALLLDRATRQLVLLSFKTTASWDVRKARNAEHDMQGLTEGIEIERRLASLWAELHDGSLRASGLNSCTEGGPAVIAYLRECPEPPRILAVRYEYLQKGSRWTDKDLTARFGFEARCQRSPLVRAYRGQGKAASAGWCWSWDFMKDDGQASKLAWQNWKAAPVWESMPIAQWIDMLDESAMAMSGEDATVGLGPRELGYSSPAQAIGYTATHPLDEVFLPPVTLYRNEDDLRDLVDSLEYQERQIAEHVAEIEAATDEGERRHLLNIYFEPFRHSCEYPSRCGFVPICYGGEDIRRDPIGSGLYQVRRPNHPEGGGE